MVAASAGVPPEVFAESDADQLAAQMEAEISAHA